MSSLSRGVGGLLSSSTSFQFHSNHSPPYPRKISRSRRHTQIPSPRIQKTMASILRSPSIVSELAEDDILQTFIKERESSGDIVAKVSDILWLRQFIRVDSADSEADVTHQLPETLGEKNEGGFLKLTRTREWVTGDNSAPVNQKMIAKKLQNDSERRKMLNLLRYEALKREMLLLTMGIGTVCSGYCLATLSVQAAVSYATGVLFSCLYLQLLCNHADNISKETVPQIFWQKKTKKIGIGSQDIQNWFEMTVQGSGIALSSPRLVIPAAIYGVWGLSHHFASDLFDFQLAPAMVGMFAYKAAALVQVYRDNEELQTNFPDSGEGSSD